MATHPITVLTWARNERDMMPFFLRHYDFADKIIVWDNHSDDDTREIVESHPKAELREWNTGGMFDEIGHTRVKEREYKNTGYGWKIVVDTDEFVWAPEGIRVVLDRCDRENKNILRSQGFDMVSEEMPIDDGVSQLTDLVQWGIPNPRYDKVCIFRRVVDVHYEHGCHTCRGGVYARPTIIPFHCLLHYKFLGRERVKDRAKWMQSVVMKEQQAMGINVELTDVELQAARWDYVWRNKGRVIK